MERELLRTVISYLEALDADSAARTLARVDPSAARIAASLDASRSRIWAERSLREVVHIAAERMERAALTVTDEDRDRARLVATIARQHAPTPEVIALMAGEATQPDPAAAPAAPAPPRAPR